MLLIASMKLSMGIYIDKSSEGSLIGALSDYKYREPIVCTFFCYIMCIVYCARFIIHCVVFSLPSTFPNWYVAHCSANCTLFGAQCVFCSVLCAVCSALCTICPV